MTHVVPNFDLREHQLDPSCWCEPVADTEVDELWVHNAADHREDYECGKAVN